MKTFAQDLDVLDGDPECKRLSWRHGISRNVLDKKLRVSEVANWMEYQVLPTRVKRGRG
jgi:GMP synthase (glutamine-hydrolysing)